MEEGVLRQIRGKLEAFYSRNKRMPSFSELAELAGYASKNAAYKLAEHLEEAGLVARDDTGKLVPGHLFGEVRVLGLVEAGFPTAAEEEMLDTMSLDDYLIEKREATFMLRVKGDSMIDAGIQEGDMVIVERDSSPRVGDIVIAEVDGEWTMKYYRTSRGRAYLEPANKNYSPIYPEGDLKIAAIVKGVIRKY